jgi:hypothetical protein
MTRPGLGYEWRLLGDLVPKYGTHDDFSISDPLERSQQFGFYMQFVV